MTKKYFILIAIFNIFINLSCSSNTNQSKIKHIFVDFGGTAFYKDKQEAIRTVGYTNIAKGLIVMARHQIGLQEFLYKTLSRLKSSEKASFIQETEPAYDDNGIKLPPVMIDWLCENKTIDKIEKEIHQLKHGLFEEDVIKGILQTMRAKNLVNILKPNRELFRILKKYKDAGYKIIALTNMEKSVIEEFKQAYKEECAFFDDIISSGEVQKIKPTKDMFEHALKRANTNAESAVLIDDDRYNIRAAAAIGIKTITFENNSAVEKQLESMILDYQIA